MKRNGPDQNTPEDSSTRYLLDDFVPTDPAYFFDHEFESRELVHYPARWWLPDEEPFVEQTLPADDGMTNMNPKPVKTEIDDFLPPGDEDALPR
jgi:hypothetical protein